MTSATLPLRSAAQPPSPLYARAHELDERVRHLGLRRRKDKAAMANALLELKESGLYKFLGYASMTAYGQTVEGLGASTTSELLKVADGARRLPKIRAEFEAGRLPSAKAAVIVGVATPEDEEKWLALARRHQPNGLRALARGEEPKHRQSCAWTPTELAWVDDAVRWVRDTGGPFEFAAALAEVCRRAMHGEGVGEGKAPGSKRGARPLLVLTQGEDGVVTRETSQGPVPADAETVEWARREGEVVDLSQGPPPVAPPAGEVKRAIPQAVRRSVDARDGDRCSFPGCTHRSDLEVDHFDGWKNGHDPLRMGKLCRAHHAKRGRGYFRVETGEDGVRRFFLRDETYVGAAGDRSRADVRREFVSTNSSAGAAPEAPQRGRKARRPGGLPEPLGQELADALKALEKLELKPREARERLARALAAQPQLAGATASEVVRAVLVAA